MFRGGTGWLLSRNTAVAALGFVLSLIGALGSAFYLEPAQSTEDAASQEIVLKSARARMHDFGTIAAQTPCNHRRFSEFRSGRRSNSRSSSGSR